MPHAVRIDPFLLAADFTRLGEKARAVADAGVDRSRLDIMGGRFVPSVSYDPAVVSPLRRHCAVPRDMCLMIASASPYLAACVGTDTISLQTIRQFGKRADVMLNPMAALENVLDLCDLLLVMSVNPGFGGQSFLESQVPKIAALGRMIEETGGDIASQMDGGVSALFGAPDYAKAIAALRGRS